MFEKIMKAFNLGVLPAQEEKDVQEGRTKDARTFLKEMKKGAEISS